MTHVLSAGLVLPMAHVGHWLWVFYLLPVLIVVGGIVRSTRAEKKREAEEDDDDEGGTGGDGRG